MTNVRDHYADSSIRPVINHVGWPVLYGKIREQLQNKLSDTDEDSKVQVVVRLRWLDVFPEEALSMTAYQTSTTPRLICEVGSAAIE
jgi:hypothetical protein